MTESSVRVLLQAAGDVPPDDGWLAPEERRVLAGLHIPKRRKDWRLGRWTAKRILWSIHGGDVRIEAAADGAPEAHAGGERLRLVLSITHRDGRAACAVGPASSALGCDLEAVEPRSTGFVADYFTGAERIDVGEASPDRRDLLVALVWSAKESALKAMRTGLRVDTRSVEVTARLNTPPEQGWRPLQLTDRTNGRRFSGWWREEGGLVLTIVADPPAGPPLLFVA